jgi:hypothetical protein
MMSSLRSVDAEALCATPSREIGKQVPVVVVVILPRARNRSSNA